MSRDYETHRQLALSIQSIVADTTPLNYLVLIQAADILPTLYGRFILPLAVKAELAHANTPRNRARRDFRGLPHGWKQ